MDGVDPGIRRRTKMLQDKYPIDGSMYIQRFLKRDDTDRKTVAVFVHVQ